MPSAKVRAVPSVAPDVVFAGTVHAGTAAGLARYAAGRWSRVEPFAARVEALAVREGRLFVTHLGLLWRLEGERAEKIASLPAGVAVRSLAAGATILAGTDQGLWELAGTRFQRVAALDSLLASGAEVRQTATSRDGGIAVAARAGLFLREANGQWRALYPRDDSRSWAPADARAVAFDERGRQRFASPEGAGVSGRRTMDAVHRR